jgi:hypothetical protein
LIEEQRPQVAGPLLDQQAEQRFTGAGVAEVDFFDHAGDAGQLPFFELVDRPQLAHVLIGARKIEDQVAGVMQIELREQLRFRRPHPFQKLGRREERVGHDGRTVHGCSIRKRNIPADFSSFDLQFTRQPIQLLTGRIQAGAKQDIQLSRGEVR